MMIVVALRRAAVREYVGISDSLKLDYRDV
jgi:hypothetical protein